MFDVSSFLNVFPSIMSGFGVTVFLAVLSLCLGCVLAMVIVVFRVKRIPVVSQLARVVISFSRSVPLIVTLYVFYYGLPSLFPALFLTGVSGNFVAVLALGIFAGGYLAETFRSSYEAVPVGQTEAARTVGLNQWQTLYHVVIPQAVCSCIPNFTSTAIDIIKGTAIVYNISIFEIMGQAIKVGSKGYRFIEAFTAAWVIYLVFAFFVYYGLARIEKRISRKYGLVKA